MAFQLVNYWLCCGLFSIALTLSGCFDRMVVPETRLRQAFDFVERGSTSLREGRVDEASKMFSVAAELAPIAAAVDGQGCVALIRGDFEQAEVLFKRAYEMDSTYDEALANLGLVLDISGQAVEAKKAYDQVVMRLPGHVGARNNRAALEYDIGADKMSIARELEKAGLLARNSVVTENIRRLARN